MCKIFHKSFWISVISNIEDWFPKLLFDLIMLSPFYYPHFYNYLLRFVCRRNLLIVLFSNKFQNLDEFHIQQLGRVFKSLL